MQIFATSGITPCWRKALLQSMIATAEMMTFPCLQIAPIDMSTSVPHYCCCMFVIVLPKGDSFKIGTTNLERKALYKTFNIVLTTVFHGQKDPLINHHLCVLHHIVR